MNRSGTMRTPAFGVVPPRAVIGVAIEKPIRDGEIPVVLSRTPGALIVRMQDTQSLTIENTTSVPIPYMMIVTTQALYRLAGLPWKRLWDALQTRQGRAQLGAQLHRWLTGRTLQE